METSFSMLRTQCYSCLIFLNHDPFIRHATTMLSIQHPIVANIQLKFIIDHWLFIHFNWFTQIKEHSWHKIIPSDSPATFYSWALTIDWHLCFVRCSPKDEWRSCSLFIVYVSKRLRKVSQNKQNWSNGWNILEIYRVIFSMFNYKWKLTKFIHQIAFWIIFLFLIFCSLLFSLFRSTIAK